MTTFVSTRVAPSQTTTGRQVSAQGWLGRVIHDFASILVNAHPVTGDVYQMLRVPKGATIIGGRLFGTALTTAGTSTGYDIDVGWASNTSALGNLGALAGAIIAGFKPEAGYYYPLGGLLFATGASGGPQTMDIERTILLTVNTSAASANFQTGTLALEIEYVMTGAP